MPLARRRKLLQLRCDILSGTNVFFSVKMDTTPAAIATALATVAGISNLMNEYHGQRYSDEESGAIVSAALQITADTYFMIADKLAGLAVPNAQEPGLTDNEAIEKGINELLRSFMSERSDREHRRIP